MRVFPWFGRPSAAGPNFLVRDQELLALTYEKLYGSQFPADDRELTLKANDGLRETLHQLLGNFEVDAYRSRMAESGLPDNSGIVDELRNGSLPIHIGLSNEQAVSAHTELAPGGVLIVLTTGLIWLARQMCYLMCAATGYGDEPTSPTIQWDYASARFATAVRDAQEGRWRDFEIELSESASDEAEYLIDRLIEFVISHEVAHILLGHIGVGQRDQRIPLPHPFQEHFYSQQEELTADQLAVHLVAGLFPSGSEGKFVGAVIFFDLLDAVEMHRVRRSRSLRSYFREIRQRASATHPHPAYRRDVAIQTWFVGGSPPKFEVIDRLAWRIGAVVGRSLPERDFAAMQTLDDMSDESLYYRIVETFQFDKWTPGGPRLVRKDLVEKLMEGPLEHAKATVATAAAMYLRLVTNHLFVVSVEEQLILAHLYYLFYRLHINSEATPAAKEFNKLLYAAVPELDDIIDLLIQTIN